MAQQLGGTSDVDSSTTKCTEHVLSQHSDGVPTKIKIFIIYLFGFCLYIPPCITIYLRPLEMKIELMIRGSQEQGK